MHPVRQRRREHHGQAQRRMRQTTQNEANILDKAEIEHTIRFVHDRHLDMAQIEHMLFEIVDDAAWRADQYVDAFLENAPLLFVVYSAEHDGELEARILADSKRIGVDLHRQFPSRRDDDGARRIQGAVCRSRIGQQAIEQGD